ncbi:MAG: hypothetical protein WCO56_04495 [Verrucomicrobiota bacterium]
MHDRDGTAAAVKGKLFLYFLSLINLDFHDVGRDERDVFSVPTSFYARWCLSPGADGLREAPVDPPPEKLLQVIWLHQRLKRLSLRLVDGRSLRVLHPGFWIRNL